MHVGHDNRLDIIYSMVYKLLYGGQHQSVSQFPLIKMDSSQIAKSETEEIVPAADGGKLSHMNAFTKELIGSQLDDDEELSIPVEHNTAAHKLLQWDSIKKLLRGYDADYVMILEEQRGLVRHAGRGEARVFDDMSAQPIPQPLSQPASFNSSLDNAYSQYPSPASTWKPSIKYNESPLEIRGIDDDGWVSIDAETIKRYFQNYLNHIHKLHPFLDQNALERKIDQFIAMHCPRSGQSATRHCARDATDNRGAKRKRSGETTAQHSPQIILPDNKGPHRVSRTIPNVIILLVLALGRICEVRNEPIRGPCTDNIIDYRNEPIPSVPSEALSPDGANEACSMYDSVQSPFQHHSVSTPSRTTDENFITLPDPPHLQNVDTVPGLVYYTYAANILGESQGATSLPYAQAALLAGLYTGQLAHPFQSHSWITQAARACQILVLP